MRFLLYGSLIYGWIFGLVAVVNGLGWAISFNFRASNPEAPFGITVGAAVALLGALCAGLIAFRLRSGLSRQVLLLTSALLGIALAAVAFAIPFA